MGSFTDAITQFNPYVAQLPVDAMVKVGMQKQAQYEEGYKKIQGEIDRVVGLDIMRDVDKEYLQSKLDELGGNLRTFAAGDFSNFQLVNSVGGMARQVGKDKFIQTAVSSTANHRKQVSEMEADKKKGTLTPDNEYYYNKQLSSYLNSGLKDDSGNPVAFSGKYIPNFDVFKFAKESFDAVKPDGFSFDQVYVTDANGNPKIDPKTKQPIYSPVMVRMEQEGVFPEKVKETLEQVFSDPRVAQQLNISGQYNYRNFTPDQLSEKILSQKQQLLGSYQNQLNELNLKKNSGKDVQSQIDALTQKMQQTDSTYNEYAKTAIDNPDGVRGQIYKDDVSSNYTTMFGWTKKKELSMDNPGWNANFKLMQEANDVSEFEQTLRQRKLEHADDMKKWELDYEQRERLAKLKGKEKTAGDEGTGPSGGAAEQADQPANIDIINKFDTDYTAAAQGFRSTSDDFLWNNVFSGVGKNNAELDRLIKAGYTREKAMSAMIDKAAQLSGQDPVEYRSIWGKTAETNYQKLSPQQRAANPSMEDSYNVFRNSRKNFDVMTTIKKNIEKETEKRLGPGNLKYAGLLESVPQEQIINFRGKQIKLTKDDIYNMAVYVRGNESLFPTLRSGEEGVKSASKTAYQKLQAKGLGDLADQQLNELTSPISSAGVNLNLITGAFRAIKGLVTTGLHPSDAHNAQVLGQLSKQIGGVYSKINNDEYTNGITTKADVIKSAYGIKPNLKVGLTSDDVGVNRVTYSKIKNWSGAYMSGQTQNMSYDFKNFAEYIGKTKNMEDANIEAQIIIDDNNNPQIELVAYDDEGNRKGGMTIQKDEAKNIGLDANALYESRDVSMTRYKINNNNNQTSSGNPKDRSTYIQGDVYFDRQDFTGMGNAPYDVKANIIFRNGIYYPVMYASDGKNETKVPRELPGSENLQQVMTFLKQSVNPTYVSSIIAESAVLNQ